MNPNEKHSKLGTCILKSSCLVVEFQILISFLEQVPKTSEYSLLKILKKIEVKNKNIKIFEKLLTEETQYH
jgi:hypothetical protein